MAYVVNKIVATQSRDPHRPRPDMFKHVEDAAGVQSQACSAEVAQRRAAVLAGQIARQTASGLYGTPQRDWRQEVAQRLKTVTPTQPLEKTNRPALADRIHDRLNEWATRMGYVTHTIQYKKFSSAHFEKLAIYSLPNSSEDVIFEAAKLISWLYLRDDALDNKTSQLGRNVAQMKMDNLLLREILHPTRSVGKKPQELTPQELSLKDLIKDIAPVDLRRISTRLIQYFEADAVECEWRLTGDTPPDTFYKVQRVHTGACKVFFELVGAYEDENLTDEDKKDVQYQALEDLTSLIVGLHNDLFSAGKESTEDHPENLVLFRMRRHMAAGMTEVDAFGRAFSETIQEVNQLVDEFEVVKIHMAPKYLRAVCRMENLIRGNIQFSTETPRYAGMPIKFQAVLALARL